MYTNLLPIIDLDLIVFIILAIILWLYQKKFTMTTRLNKIYFTIVVITMTIIMLEVLDKVVLVHPVDAFIPLTKIINILGFSLSPVVPFLYLIYLREYFKQPQKYAKVMLLPLLLNAFICIMSYNGGYIFSVEVSNTYVRGPLFLIPMTLTLVYFGFTLLLVHQNKAIAHHTDQLVFSLLGTLPILAALIQIFFNELLLIWGTVGIVIITHYLHLQEILLKYDSLTGIWNRMAFESHFNSTYLNKNKSFSLIYLDVNDFKFINDHFGHNEGDIALQAVATTLHQTFKSNGKVARLGGDEFIVIANITNEVELTSSLQQVQFKLDQFTTEYHKGYPLKISLGYKQFNNNHLTLTDYINEIDSLMYLDKQKRKLQAS